MNSKSMANTRTSIRS
jgi:hypothetical protein